MTKEELQKEFDRQTEILLTKGYPQESNLSTEKFRKILEPLKAELPKLRPVEPDLIQGYVPFLIVIKAVLVSTEKAMSLVEKDGKKGIIKLFPLEPKDFRITDEVKIPDKMAYLAVNLDRGKDSINMAPKDALNLLKENNSSPLTIDEGIALITQFPEFLMKNNCFSLLASRHTGDKRVPAIWINANKNPNLGWCWDGNPHTWLGSASCKYRI